MDIIILHFLEEETEVQSNSVICFMISVCFRVRIPSPLHHSCFSMTNRITYCRLLSNNLPTSVIWLLTPIGNFLCNFYENKVLDSWNCNLITKGCNKSCYKDYVLSSGTSQPAQLCLVALFWKKRAVHSMDNYTFVKFSLDLHWVLAWKNTSQRYMHR